MSNKQDKSNHYQEAIELIKALANINSHSYNLDGIAQVSIKIQAEYQKRFKNIKIEEIELPDQISVDNKGQELKIPLGKALSIKRINANAGAKPILLMGHMDTVFPVDSKFQTCTEIQSLSEKLPDARLAKSGEAELTEPELFRGNYIRKSEQVGTDAPGNEQERNAAGGTLRTGSILNGPGVADLKGGLVVMMQALELFEASTAAGKIAWQVFLNPDEEIGSPGSQTLFPELAKNNELGLIYEPGLEDGSIAYRRKGAGNFKLIAHGKAAHVGRAFNEGASAILAISDFIQAANKLNSDSIIINFGKIEGGGALNVVPDLASLGINIRIDNNDDMALVETKLNEIIDKINQTQDIKLELHGKFNRKPKIPNEKLEELYNLIASCAKELDIPISKCDTGGCCDGNNLFEHGLVNIDTLGVRGGKIHSAEEFVCLDSIEERVNLSLAILKKLSS